MILFDCIYIFIYIFFLFVSVCCFSTSSQRKRAEKGEEDKEEEGAEGKGSREIKDPPGSGGVDRLGQEKKPLLRQKSDKLRSEIC